MFLSSAKKQTNNKNKQTNKEIALPSGRLDIGFGPTWSGRRRLDRGDVTRVGRIDWGHDSHFLSQLSMVLQHVLCINWLKAIVWCVYSWALSLLSAKRRQYTWNSGLINEQESEINTFRSERFLRELIFAQVVFEFRLNCGETLY